MILKRTSCDPCIYNADKQRYGKLFEQMEYDMLQRKKDLFPNMIADACRVLTG